MNNIYLLPNLPLITVLWALATMAVSTNAPVRQALLRECKLK